MFDLKRGQTNIDEKDVTYIFNKMTGYTKVILEEVL